MKALSARSCRRLENERSGNHLRRQEPRMARGGIEPPTRGFSVLIRPYTFDQHRTYRATISEVRVAACCSSSHLGAPGFSTVLARAPWRRGAVLSVYDARLYGYTANDKAALSNTADSLSLFTCPQDLPRTILRPPFISSSRELPPRHPFAAGASRLVFI